MIRSLVEHGRVRREARVRAFWTPEERTYRILRPDPLYDGEAVACGSAGSPADGCWRRKASPEVRVEHPPVVPQTRPALETDQDRFFELCQLDKCTG